MLQREACVSKGNVVRCKFFNNADFDKKTISRMPGRLDEALSENQEAHGQKSGLCLPATMAV